MEQSGIEVAILVSEVGGWGWVAGWVAGWGLGVGCLAGVGGLPVCGLLARRCKRPVWAGKGFEAAVW